MQDDDLTPPPADARLLALANRALAERVEQDGAIIHGVSEALEGREVQGADDLALSVLHLREQVGTLTTALRRARLELWCEQGKTRDPETGEALPWTVAGWLPAETCVGYTEVRPAWWRPGGPWRVHGLTGLERHHNALGLPPLVGVEP